MATEPIKKTAPPTARRLHMLDGLLLLLAIVVVIALVYVYVSRERFFYFYDAAGYQGITADLAYTFTTNPTLALKFIKDSINLEYNYLFALPLIPFLILFGDHRLVYELTAALLYQLPYALVLGAIASRLIAASSALPAAASSALPAAASSALPAAASSALPAAASSALPATVNQLPDKLRQVDRRRRLAFWITVFVTLANPTAWGPLLRGLPDVGAALLIALAVWVYLLDPTLKRPWQIVATGGLLALAMIFRRHFAYAVGAFYVAVSLQYTIQFLLQVRKVGRPAWTAFWHQGLRLCLAAAVTLLVTVLLALPFLTRIFTVNYTALYASYLLPWKDLLLFYADQYRTLVLILVVLGFVLGLRLHLLDKAGTLFILLFTGIVLVVWNTFAGQRGMQYSLHFTYLIILGLSALLLTILVSTNPRYRLWLAIPLAAFLVVNALAGMLWPPPAPFGRLLSYGYRPMLRSDYAEVARLVAYLRQVVPPGAPIYVVDSSYAMNADMIAKAEQNLYGRPDANFTVLVSPIIDSRDNYPLESLLNAQFVVFSTPAQYHMIPEEQEVIGATYEAFQQDWEIAQDFTRLPETFKLAADTVLNVFQRQRPTSLETAVVTFNRMRELIGDRPGSQLDWVNLGLQRLGISQNKSGRFDSIAGSTEPAKPVEMGFLYVEDPPESGNITGRVEWNKKACKELLLEARMTRADGSLLSTNQVEITERQGLFALPFQRTSPSGEAATNLILRAITPQGGTSSNACTVELRWSLDSP